MYIFMLMKYMRACPQRYCSDHCKNLRQKRSDEIRNKYIQNPPEGMTADDIRHMSEDDLLDMDYFLNEDDEFGEDFPGAEGFYIF